MKTKTINITASQVMESFPEIEGRDRKRASVCTGGVHGGRPQDDPPVFDVVEGPVVFAREGPARYEGRYQ